VNHEWRSEANIWKGELALMPAYDQGLKAENRRLRFSPSPAGWRESAPQTASLMNGNKTRALSLSIREIGSSPVAVGPWALVDHQNKEANHDRAPLSK
jgi:hypothetical protein